MKDLYDNMEEYVKDMVDGGYMTHDLVPIKCHHCEGEELEECHFVFDGYRVCEYQIRCSECDKIIGTWAYGHWTL